MHFLCYFIIYFLLKILITKFLICLSFINLVKYSNLFIFLNQISVNFYQFLNYFAVLLSNYSSSLIKLADFRKKFHSGLNLITLWQHLKAIIACNVIIRSYLNYFCHCWMTFFYNISLKENAFISKKHHLLYHTNIYLPISSLRLNLLFCYYFFY